jgi:NADPH-dependent 2,4-dienoyl-CoA reductase/sulfur reductase-like enzyme
MNRLLIIGGSDAGISAALRAREVDRTAEVTVLIADSFANYRQGRVAGENAVGGQREFAGSLGTQVVKVFDVVVARTGLRDAEAEQAGFDPLTVESTSWDHKVYYPGAHALHIRVTRDRKTGRLLGAQMVGHVHGEVAKRIDIFAAALYAGIAVNELNDLDLSYTPPVSSPWDPVQMSAQSWVKQQQH